MKDCKITITDSTVDEVLERLIAQGASCLGKPDKIRIAQSSYQVRVMNNEIGWSRKEYYDHTEPYSSLPEITLEELRKMKSLHITREIYDIRSMTLPGTIQYKLNGFDVLVSSSNLLVQVRWVV